MSESRWLCRYFVLSPIYALLKITSLLPSQELLVLFPGTPCCHPRNSVLPSRALHALYQALSAHELPAHPPMQLTLPCRRLTPPMQEEIANATKMVKNALLCAHVNVVLYWIKMTMSECCWLKYFECENLFIYLLCKSKCAGWSIYYLKLSV